MMCSACIKTRPNKILSGLLVSHIRYVILIKTSESDLKSDIVLDAWLS